MEKPQTRHKSFNIDIVQWCHADLSARDRIVGLKVTKLIEFKEIKEFKRFMQCSHLASQTFFDVLSWTMQWYTVLHWLFTNGCIKSSKFITNKKQRKVLMIFQMKAQTGLGDNLISEITILPKLKLLVIFLQFRWISE